MRYRPIEVEDVIAETDLALLFRIDGETRWIPKSQIEDVDSISVGDSDIEANVSEWFCDREGF